MISKKIFGVALAAAFAIAGNASAQKICIDPGHGGSDPGATGGGQTEAANVLDKGLKLRTWLNADTGDGSGGGSWTVIITRTTNVFVELSGRTSYANSNGAARFMSIHNNAFSNTTANGIETYCHTSGGTSTDLRNKVYEEALAMWPLTARGAKTATFYVLTYTSMPAELHEAAFITNTADRVYLGSATHRDNQSKSQMFGLQRHYGLAKYTPSSGSTIVTVDNASAGFSQGGTWWTSTSTAGYYGSNYHTRGTAAVSAAATFTGSIPTSGTYRVDAWWTAGANRAASAPYIIARDGGTTTVNVNQQVNGGAWRSLGNHAISSGSRTVQLSCWTTAGFYVVADAVRWVKQ